MRMTTKWVADREDGKEVWAVGNETTINRETVFTPGRFIVVSPDGVIRGWFKTKKTACNSRNV